MKQASVFDGFSFDPFPFQQDGLTAPEVDVGRRQIVDALVVAQVILVGDEGFDPGLELAGQIVVLQQERERIKRKTIEHRRLLHKTHAA